MVLKEQESKGRGGFKAGGQRPYHNQGDAPRQQHGGHGRGKPYPPKEGNDFATNVMKPTNQPPAHHHMRQEEPMDVFQRQEANKFKQQLADQSKSAIEKARSDKNIEQ
jgi:hypothetical protein